MNKPTYIDFEYLKQNNPNPTGIQFKGLFGNRSIGKTHGVLKHLWKTRISGEAIMLLRRNKLELNFQPFVTKYSNAFNTEWQLESNWIVENHNEIIAYYSALSLAERSKHNNYDTPYVTNIIVDEVFAEKPNKNEFQQLETWITTLSRRTGFPFHPITIWLLGNYDYGYSPILDSLNIFSFNGRKQKTDNGVYLFSNMESPQNVLNVKNPLIREMEIKKENLPLVSWIYKKQSFGLFDCGTHLYMKNIDRATDNYDYNIKAKIFKFVMQKRGLPPLFVANYDCLRFVDIPDIRME
jgi:hypothetical protein